MFSSFSSSEIDCQQRLIVFILTILAIIFSGSVVNYKYDNSFGFIMPVITRSQSRCLISIPASPQVCLECSSVRSNDTSTMMSLSSTTKLSSSSVNTSLSSSLLITDPSPVELPSSGLIIQNLAFIKERNIYFFKFFFYQLQ